MLAFAWTARGSEHGCSGAGDHLLRGQTDPAGCRVHQHLLPVAQSRERLHRPYSGQEHDRQRRGFREGEARRLGCHETGAGDHMAFQAADGDPNHGLADGQSHDLGTQGRDAAREFETQWAWVGTDTA